MPIPQDLRKLLTAEPSVLNTVLFGKPCTNNFVFGAMLLPLQGGWKISLLVDHRKAWDLSEGTVANSRLRHMLLQMQLPVDMIFFTLQQRNSGDFPTEYLQALQADECHVFSRHNEACTWSRIFEVVSNSGLQPGATEVTKLRALGCASNNYHDARSSLLAQLRIAPHHSLPDVRACLSIVRYGLRLEKFFSEWEHVAVVV